MGVGPGPLEEEGFPPQTTTDFYHYRVHELGLWYQILELFLCQKLDFEIYI